MSQSETIGKLAEALSQAQGEMTAASKDKNNPFFKSSYADLTSVWEAAQVPLTKYKLAVSQCPECLDTRVILRTKLLHVSGEWIESTLPVNPVKNDPQGLGSAITYMRRFALAAILCIVPEDPDMKDDDGNKASGRQMPKESYKASEPVKKIDVKGVVKSMPKAEEPFDEEPPQWTR